MFQNNFYDFIDDGFQGFEDTNQFLNDRMKELCRSNSQFTDEVKQNFLDQDFSCSSMQQETNIPKKQFIPYL